MAVGPTAAAGKRKHVSAFACAVTKRDQQEGTADVCQTAAT